MGKFILILFVLVILGWGIIEAVKDDEIKDGESEQSTEVTDPSQARSLSDVSEIPTQDIDLSLGGVRITKASEALVACPESDGLDYLVEVANSIIEATTEKERDIIANLSAYQLEAKGCMPLTENHVLAFTDTLPQTSLLVGNTVTFVESDVFSISDDGSTERLGTYWSIIEFTGNSEFAKPVKISREKLASETDADTSGEATPQKSEKDEVRLRVKIGDRLVYCPTMQGVQAVLAAENMGGEQVVFRNYHCSFFQSGDTFALFAGADFFKFFDEDGEEIIISLVRITDRNGNKFKQYTITNLNRWILYAEVE